MHPDFFLFSTSTVRWSVFRIRDTLVWIRILLFVTFKMPTENFFSQALFCLLPFEGLHCVHHTGNSQLKSHKIVEIKVFPYYFFLTMEGSGSETASVPLTNRSGSEGPWVPDPDPKYRWWWLGQAQEQARKKWYDEPVQTGTPSQKLPYIIFFFIRGVPTQ
jgi:hypothetical protein